MRSKTCLLIFLILVAITKAQRIRPIITNADFDIYKLTRLGQDQLELTCEVKEDYVSESSPLHWERNGLNLTTNDRITVTPNKLVIKKVEKEDIDGTYTCSATYNGYPIQSNFELAVPPHITIKKDGTTIYQGEKMELRCSVLVGNPLPKISWDINGANYADSTERMILMDDKGVENSILIINHTDLSDTGNYTCIANNVANTGIDTKFIKIEQTAQPKITILGNNIIYKGEKVQLKCSVSQGKPLPTEVSWEIPNGSLTMIIKSGNERIKLTPDSQGVRNAILTIDKSIKSDAGFYTCIAKNIAGEVKSKSIHVQIKRDCRGFWNTLYCFFF